MMNFHSFGLEWLKSLVLRIPPFIRSDQQRLSTLKHASDMYVNSRENSGIW